MSFPGYQNAFGFPGVYFADITAKPLLDGEGSPLLTDIYRRLIVVSGAPAPSANIAYTVVDNSTALEKSSVSKASAGLVGKFFGMIDASAASGTYYVQLYDAASLPADGAVTLLVPAIKIVHALGADDFWDLDFEPKELTASTGIVWAISTTQFTKTIVGSNIAVATLLGY